MPEVGHVVPCDTDGCGEPAFVRDEGRNYCHRCYEGRRNTEAFERCKAMGLNTVEDMRAYCRQMLKKGIFEKPSFERWAETMKQATVDAMVRMCTDSDLKTIGRLRAMCAIDADNKIVPLEKRQALRSAMAARIAAESALEDAPL